MLAILLLNSGYTLQFSSNEILNDEVEAMVVAVADHQMDFDGIVAWVKQRLIKFPVD